MEMEMEMIAKLESIFYDNYYKHFLLSNLPNVDQLYIPLAASEFDTSSADRIEVRDIQSRIISNLSATTVLTNKSFLVFGDGGTGKTTLALGLVNECWKKYRAAAEEQVIIPVYIYLPQFLRFKQRNDILSLFIELYLPSFKEVKDDITVADLLKIVKSKYELLLVLDGYDNYLDKRNLWEQNKFGEYNLRTVIFCRPDALSESEFRRTFSYNVAGARGTAKYYFLLPFTSAQISSYLLNVVEFLRNLDSVSVESNDTSIEPWHLTKEITQRYPIWERDSSEYRHWFQLILPELGEVSQTPFLLCLLVQVLPTIVEEYRHRPNQSSFHMDLIQLVSTEVGIYDQFTRRWFDYSSDKISQIHTKLNEIKSFLPQLLEIYSNNLALRFFNREKGFVKDGKFPIKLTEEWDLWKPDDNSRAIGDLVAEINNVARYFPQSEEEKNAEKQIHLRALRSGCLLRYFNFQSQGENKFQFLHASLLEYFVSRTIFKGLRAELNFHMKQVGVRSTQFKFSFESIRSNKYAGTLHMIVERARTDSDFKDLLLSVVRTSKEISSLRVMSSNAFTILTQAFRAWCNEDFSYVNVADADMSHCVFINCKFNGADMSRALLTGTFFYQSHLQAANLYHSYIARGLNFHLQEGVKPIDRKSMEQFQVFVSQDDKKIYIIYSNRYREGLCDLCLFDVKKRSSKIIMGSPNWSLVEYRKFQQHQDVFLVALESYDESQTIGTFGLKNLSTPQYLDQAYLRAQQENCQPHQATKLSLSFSVDEVPLGPTNHKLEIFTVAVPNYDKKVVCYRTPAERDGRIVASSFYFSLTTTLHPFNFSICSSHNILNSSFCLCQLSLNSTLLATTSNDFVSLFELERETVLFKKPFSQPQHEGQIVVTFIRFSPDGKYLLFDMSQTLYILTLKDNPAGLNTLSLRGVSLRGSKGGFDSLLDCDFAPEGYSQPLVALVYEMGIPLIVDLATGQHLQSIKLQWECAVLSFLSDKDDELQLVCASRTGLVSSHKIHRSSHAGDPRSIRALNPQTDFHSLINTSLEHIDTFVSVRGKYMAVIKHQKHQFFKMDGNFHADILFCLLLFKIDGNSGKRTFVFQYTFSSLNKRDINVAFINETFVCLMYPNEFKAFKCETPYLTNDNAADPISVQISYGPGIITNFQRSWYHEPSQQIIFQQKDSFVLEILSIDISADNSSISLNAPRFRFDIQRDFDCAAVKVFFHVDESDHFAYIFPSRLRLCFIWNLNSGSILTLSTSESESPYKWEDVKHVSTIFVKNGHPSGIFVDFEGPSQSFQGVIDIANETLELIKIDDRNVYQFIKFTNYFLSFYRNKSFTFGIRPSTSLLSIYPIHDVEGFQLMPVTVNLDNRTSVRLLTWDKRTVSCFEVDLSAMEMWMGDKHKFTGWRLLWCDPPNDRLSLLLSNTTNAVLGKDEDWNLLSKRFACEGNVLRSLHSFVSLSSLFEQVHETRTSIFSKINDLLLSDDKWILLVIAKKKGFLGGRLLNVNILQAHSGIIIEGVRHGRHFAFRADLFINSDKIYEITVAPLKRKKEKYLQLRKRYLAAEFPISSAQGDKIIEQILADKQSEIDYHLLYKNCNSWVKSLLSLIGVNVDRKWSFADLSNDFFRREGTENILNFPVVTATGTLS